MKFFSVVLIGVSLLVFEGSLQAKPLQILFLGNSFTHLHGGGTDADGLRGIPKRFREFAVQMGEETPIVKMFAPGGTTLEQKVNDPEVLALIKDPAFQWDYVVLQELSTFPTDANPVRTKSFYDAVEALDAIIKSVHSETKTMLYMTWARGDGHALYREYPEQLKNRFEMQSQLRKHYMHAAERIGGELAPVGNAWDRAFASDPDFGASLYDTDHYHQGAKGACLNALVFYSILYGTQPAGLVAPSDADAVSQADFDTLGVLAWVAATHSHEGIIKELVESEKHSNAAALAALAAGRAHFARHWLFDLGNKYPVSEVGWNDTPTGNARNAVDSKENKTDLVLRVIKPFGGGNNAGVNDDSVYPAAVQRDSLFVTGTGSVGTRSQAVLRLENLNPTLLYNLTFFGSRSSGGDSNRTARYTVNGKSVYLNAADNTNQFVTLAGLIPVDGTLEIIVEPFDANGVEQTYGYLGALEIGALNP